LQFENLEQRVVLDSTPIAALEGPVTIAAPTVVAAPHQSTNSAPPSILQATYLTFHLLPAELIPLLSPAQVSTIPNRQYLGLLSIEARENLTVAQVQALNVAATGIRELPPRQINYLSAEQVRQVDVVEFQYLEPAVITHLSTEQLGSFTRRSDFNAIPDGSRAALTAPQVRALDVALLGLNRLSAQQIEYLSPSQVQSLEVGDFPFLSANQIVHLSSAQIRTISSSSQFHVIPNASRAALTVTQVRALDIEVVGLANLTGQQRTFLTPQQIRKVEPSHLNLLTAQQIPHVSNAQFAAITSRSQISAMSDEAQAAISRAQMLSIPLEVLGSHVINEIAVPAHFVNPLSVLRGPDGFPTDHHTVMERNAIFALVPTASATHRTVRSGNWSDPTIWDDGQVPRLNADVLIEAAHTVTFDQVMTSAIRTLRINGQLRFAHNRNTKMLVDTIVVDTQGTLLIGTESQPIANNVTARIVFSAGSINRTWDPRSLSRGLISRGRVRIYGQEVTPYAAFQVAPAAGDTRLFLDRVPVNWKVGDELVITGTQDNANRDEYVRIRAISGNKVTIDPLQYGHSSPTGTGLSTYVANTRRNVIIESANPNVVSQRGHIMFVHNPDVQLVNAGLYGLGRTDKSRPIDDATVVNNVLQAGTGTNVRGRYAVHFHHTGIDARQTPALARGVAVVGSPGWGLVNHSSNVVMEDNVAINVTGAAFATEDGNEIGAFRRNLAIRSTGSGDSPMSRRSIHDWGHEGHGFWMQGPGVEVVGNIASGQANGAFVYFTASSKNLFSSANLDDPSLAGGKDMTLVGAVPLAQFSGNVAFASGTGLEIWFHQHRFNDSPSVLTNFTSWNIRNSHVEPWYSGQVTLRDFTLVGDLSAPAGTAILPNSFSHDLRIENLRALGFGTAITATALGNTTVVGGQFAAVRAISVGTAENATRSVLVTGDPTFVPLSPAQLDGQRQFDLYLAEQPVLSGQDFARYFSPLAARFGTVIFQGRQVYFSAQSPAFTPFPSNQAPGLIPEKLIGLSNEQLFANYGIVVGGVMAPADFVMPSRINGLVGPISAPPITYSLVSPATTSQLSAYELRYLDRYGDVVVDPKPIDLAPGWNLLTRIIEGQRYSFFVFGES
jgi:hypothetical protein